MKNWVILGITLVLLAALGFAGWKGYDYLHARLTPERCTIVSAQGESLSLTQEQSEMAAIIVAASYKAELPERAAVIALATAYQESGIRNLDYGDRDSLGLFQQRPDPRFDWGTAEQIMDPWYSSLRFYEELVKFKKWQNEDINDQAQKVQRSGHPQAYRKHVPNSTALAAALRGSVQQAITCVNFQEPAPNPDPILAVLAPIPGVEVKKEGNQIQVSSDDEQQLWAAVQLAILNTYSAGVTKVEILGQSWELNGAWHKAKTAVDGATITLGG